MKRARGRRREGWYKRRRDMKVVSEGGGKGGLYRLKIEFVRSLKYRLMST